MMLKKGDKAIDFTLKSKQASGLKDISLGSNYGKKNTVLCFFPFAFTGGCTTEMCTLGNDFNGFDDMDAIIYGISVDSPFTQEAWAKENSIGINLLSDFNKEVASAYGVLYEDFLGFKGVCKRSVFVVDKEGNIQYSWVTEDPKQMPEFNEIQSVLKQLNN